MAWPLAEQFRRNKQQTRAPEELPFSGELLGLDRLEELVAKLATTHKTYIGPGRRQTLLSRLSLNEKRLISAYQVLSDAVRRERTISPAAEWLVDNFHIVEEQLREIREDLPAGYYRKLPKLAEGNLAGYPRIYALATTLLSHTDCRLDLETLKRFVAAYQALAPLSIGELWAIAITLRVALVENLSRLATFIINSRSERERANQLADELLLRMEGEAEEVPRWFRKQLDDHPSSTFVNQLTRRLRDQHTVIAAALTYLDQRLIKQGQSTNELVQAEHRRQVTTQVSVANIISSMRLLSTIDWREFFESVSLIDPILKSDPAGAYENMDFATRDRYRRIIERLAKRAGLDELEVGRHVVTLAKRPAKSEFERHVGFYLIDAGLAELESTIGYHPTIRERLTRAILSRATPFYLGSIVTITALLIVLTVLYARRYRAPLPLVLAIVLLSLVLMSDLAINMVNWLVTSIFRPLALPKMDLSEGIPKDARTIVVIPTMLTDAQTIDDLLSRLEVHYLSNRDEQLEFALLTDFADASEETLLNDEILLTQAETGIASLNQRYCPNGQARFYIFHRRRLWNACEEKWMGWERKRGKLHEFNRLLRGAADTTFVSPGFQTIDPAGIRYVITLDSDTRLPADAARKLVGTISHPLNRPYFDGTVGRVTRGYAVIQPRISISLQSASRTWFTRIFSGNTGVDPYTTAVSDVYQDLFGEGIYTGKGLYDIDWFEAALADRVPENSLLSHDLFEGLFARTALATDIELFDDYPAQYDAYAGRQHRWTRGDWQVAALRWLSSTKPSLPRARQRLPLISSWKIIDNLRRSLLAPSLVLWLLLVWGLAPGSAVVWTLFPIIALAFPMYAHLTRTLLSETDRSRWRNRIGEAARDLKLDGLQVLLNVTFCLHQAYLMGDAIGRTIYRKLVSRRLLLEWVTAARAHTESARDFAALLRFMSVTLFMVLAIAISTALLRPTALLAAIPFLFLWLISPFVAYQLSRRSTKEIEPLRAADIAYARMLARRTWRYFETVVSEADHWLPPDNYQEDPHVVVARRTSPTNIGLFLMSTIAAHDFGYLGTLELIERLELSMTAMEKLPRFRGHFFNWYDTTNLQPLEPRYVSTVDSGNLAGHLLVIKRACNELPGRVLFDQRVVDGLSDTLDSLANEFKHLSEKAHIACAETVTQLHVQIKSCQEMLCATAPEDHLAWANLLTTLTTLISRVKDSVDSLESTNRDERSTVLRAGLGSAIHQTEELIRDLQTLTPWTTEVTRIFSSLDSYPVTVAIGLREILGSLNGERNFPHTSESSERPLQELADLRRIIEQSIAGPERAHLLAEIETITVAIKRAASANESLRLRTMSLAHLCDLLVDEVDFHFLFDERLKVLTVGYDVDTGRRDNSFYDLFASEARLASFVAIATSDVPQEHWFRLGRTLTSIHGQRALISWSATMFEYLMPLLVMREYEDTLLAETYHTVVSRQIQYGQEHGVPWGISESAFNARSLDLTYQYAAFGVPGLGLKRGLSENLVVSPYASLLAAMLEPRKALANLRRLERLGALGRFGFYDAIDFTSERLPPRQKHAVVHAFMTHHQGMSLVALDNLLHDRVMQHRFHADPLVRANELLLQERVPSGAPTVRPRAEEVLTSQSWQAPPQIRLARHYGLVEDARPSLHLLSNGTYSVMVTSSGGGYSKCGEIAVTRWREDATRDNWGSFFYLRDIGSGAVWSVGYQPMLHAPQTYEVAFSEDKATLSRHDVGITTQAEIIVSPEDNAELRRISLTNHATRVRELELTSYAEIVLVPQSSDVAHPAFGKLFIETEFVPATESLLARRRPRAKEEEPIWAVHTMAAEGVSLGPTQYETDRDHFLGRGHTTAEPVVFSEDRLLSNTTGPTLDPIFSLRRRIRLQPNETVQVCFTIAITNSRAEALRLGDKYHDVHIFERQARLAWTKSQVELRYLNIDQEEAQLFQELATRLVYVNPLLRPRAQTLALNTRGQDSLWQYGLSGDLPILLVRIREASDLRIVRQLLRAHEYLRLKGLKLDLLILNDHGAGYAQQLQDDLLDLVTKSRAQALIDKPGGVFLRRSDLIPEADRILMQTAARACIVAERGSLEDQLSRPATKSALPAEFIPRRAIVRQAGPPASPLDLKFFNGLGGFSQDGREYVTILEQGQWSPAPWLNVIANADFGFQISESGGGCTWCLNSRQNRLTPWSNDPVSDPPGEVIYLRDEDTGASWTSTPLPIRETSPYVITHGQGYSRFEHTSHGISHELLMFVPLNAPVKVSRLRLKNVTKRKRRLSIMTFEELVLGTERGASAPFILTEIDQTTEAIFARNPYNNEFARRVTFADMSEFPRDVTCDRREFIGPYRSMRAPAALFRTKLTGAVGAGLDPCMAMQTMIEIDADESREIIILFGQAESAEEARLIISKYRDSQAVQEAFAEVVSYWNELLNTIEVHTPEVAMDTLMNRWLLYQTLSSRFWGRSGFYQSSGAYGFRDQLQDVMALVYAKPEIAREHLLRAAGRQFREGDVQHWWHPPTGRGLRSRISDDALWLAYVTNFYVHVTGDRAILDKKVPFLEAPLLKENQIESYSRVAIADETASLFEHCVRAIDRSLAVGGHGLPLIGSGDWNDGMNRVGHKGHGESVWLGWFLYDVLNEFAKLCADRGDIERAHKYRQRMEKLRAALEQSWDGDWYRRAYFDDGTPMGSARSEECKIDSLAQSWAVISGAADPRRARHAMTAVEQHLIKRSEGLILLLTPPFDKSSVDPGYIKGYLPGVRENGGQYTHAGIWALIAYAMLGDGDLAGEMLDLLNPINHCDTPSGLHTYQREPYAIAGDVYAGPALSGRAGWTWYTGAAAWMYRANLEYVLGFRLRGNRLRIEPCIPRAWPGYELTYHRGKSVYRIKVENPNHVCRGVGTLELDGVLAQQAEIELANDGLAHEIRILLGAATSDKPESGMNDLAEVGVSRLI